MKIFIALLPAALLLSSCHGMHSGRALTSHIVYDLDSTASIVPASFDAAMKAIENQSAQLHRGDCISVVPIASDSDAILSEQIVRMCVPSERQAYDQDLQDFKEKLHQALAAQSRQLTDHRAAKTDILGSLKVVEQEFAFDGPNVEKTVILYSDFIEEDGVRDFTKSPDLARPESAERLARTLATDPAFGCSNPPSDWSHVRVFLGSLQSTEIPKLPGPRRDAIRRFWMAYFNARNVRPFFAADGPGMSAKFLAREEG
jgi:hypothetical protein